MNWKLTVGRVAQAWREYPDDRRRIRAVPAGPPIFVTGTHRSGTTWFARMLAASGAWYVHEPFSPRKHRWPECFSYRRPNEPSPEVDALMSSVIEGRFPEAVLVANADHRLMPLRLFPPARRRLMIKDPLACLLNSYLTQRFGLRTMVLFRHPAGFAASVCRLGWPRGGFLRQLLADDALMADHLEAHRTLMEAHANEDSLESAVVLHGALNSVLWSDVQRGIGTALYFETVCADPLGRFEHIHRELGLPHDEHVIELQRSLCFGRTLPVDAYHPHAVARNSRAAAESWRSELSTAEMLRVRRLWDRFELPMYQSPDDWRLAEAGALEASAR